MFAQSTAQLSSFRLPDSTSTTQELRNSNLLKFYPLVLTTTGAPMFTAGKTSIFTSDMNYYLMNSDLLQDDMLLISLTLSPKALFTSLKLSVFLKGFRNVPVIFKIAIVLYS